MEDHYQALLQHHPDAGSSLEDFIDALAFNVGPLLLAQPGIGRRYYPAETLLSALVDDAIVLVSARDQRQQDFH